MLKEVLQGKSVLFIGVKFYDYNLLIRQKMEAYGAEVTFFYERNISIRYALVDTFFPGYLNKFQSSHYNSILKKTVNKKFDYIFVIRGHKMPLSFIQTLKQRNPKITSIMYQWDSSIRNPYKYLIPEFDKVFSFDYKDVEDNPGVEYLTNFYTDDITQLSLKTVKNIYDFFYFGSYLPERYDGLIKFKAYAESKGYSIKAHLWMSYKYYLKERIKGNKIDKQYINFNLMKRDKYLKLLSQSKAVVDVCNRTQTGLSFRVLEALGADKKILTTNNWIVKEAGFDPERVAVIDLDNIDIPSSFLKVSTKPNLVDYSLDKWLEKVFL